ncbi:universal stress protein [Trujillonella humicola]|uniref:universal stress protein n=1 Tax=Trujillonella humicola TaxID=3383699 RepID=UPI003905B0DC
MLVLLGRQGYRNPLWYLLGAVLGPLFIPIAAERGQRKVVVVRRQPGAASGTPSVRGGLTVVVGVDGSAESDQAVRDADALFGHLRPRIVLVAVVPADDEESGGSGQVAASELLADRAGWLDPGGEPPVLEVGMGQPARVLLEIAEAEQAGVLVIGRRGRGLSHRLLGSVAEAATAQCTLPVVLATRPPERSRQSSDSTGSARPAR